MKHLSFKMRIALFTGIIVLVTALVLTVVSICNAKHQINFAVSVNTPTVTYSDAEYGDINVGVVSVENPSAEVDLSDAEAEAPLTYTIRADNASRRFNILSIIAMIITATLGMAAAYLFAGKSLKPIQELIDTTVSITENNLDMRIPERTANDEISSLTNSFNSMLDRLNEAFEQQKRFSANAAHEFKTPVAVIKTGLQTLRLGDNPTSDDYREVFEIIGRNSERLADMIDDLLMLTNKNADLPSETFSLNAMLQDIVRSLMPKYRIKEIDVKYNFDDEFFITCPETLACRLFTNLIENAFKYNRQNGQIIISVTENEVRIQDSGIGIPDKDIPHIWDSFYCVDASRSKKLGGTGLGLSIVKEIADRFGWNISVTSTVGKGSEFTVKYKNI